MKQRSSFSIITSILESAEESGIEGITRTKMMQRVMLNYKRATRYCTSMVDKQLLAYDSQSHTFHITEKGKKVLDKSRELAGFVAPINEMINRYRFSPEAEYPWNDHYPVLR
jgi:predicted transcriptional regulator